MLFRTLNANEIECRVQSSKKDDSGKLKGVILLLYKDARCDMNILDETVGPMKWKREHSRENANCTVSIYSDDIKEWISKEDTGTDSKADPEKGRASDSFKRACVNWGIGRELYSAPFIWIQASNVRNEYDRFIVTDIGYDENRNINHLVIYNDTTKKKVFTFNGGDVPVPDAPAAENDPVENQKINTAKVTALTKRAQTDHVSLSLLCDLYGVTALEDITEAQLSAIVNTWSTEVVPKCRV